MGVQSFPRLNTGHVVRASAAALLLTGCYDFRQLDPQQPLAGGMYVRVELTDVGTTRVAPAIGPYAQFVEGQLQSADAQGLTMALQSVKRRGEEETTWHGETLSLTRLDIRFVNERRPARGRTALAATAFTAAGAAVIVFIAKATGLVSGGSGRPGIPGS